MDADIVFDRDVEEMLLAVALSDRISAPIEIHHLLASHPAVGSTLIQGAGHSPRYAADFNAGTLGIPNLREHRGTLDLIRRIIVNRIDLFGRDNLPWVDQEIANYVSYCTANFDTHLLSRYVRVGVPGMEHDPGHRTGVVHFWPFGPAEDKLRGMITYLETLRRNAPRGVGLTRRAGDPRHASGDVMMNHAKQAPMDDAEYHALLGMIWGGPHEALAEQRIAPELTWVHAVQTQVMMFGGETALSFPREKLPPYIGVAVIMMVKDESDIILDNLRWSYLIGVRRFAIMDNASADGTWKLLEYFRDHFRDAEVMLVSDPTVRHLQAQKTNGLFRLAQSYWPDLGWIIPVDADEFLIPMEGLAALERVPADVDALVVAKAVHFRLRGLQGPPLKRMPLRSSLFAVPPKVVLRADPGLSLTQGNHYAERHHGPPVGLVGGLHFGLYVREFPNRSFEHLLTKIRNGGRAIVAAHEYGATEVGGEHWLHLYRRWQAGGDEAIRSLYEEVWYRTEYPGLVTDPFDIGDVLIAGNAT